MPQVDQLINGTLISPGTTYYVKYRYRDIHGNLSLPSLATTIVSRYTNRHPAARVRRNTTATAVFQANRWTTYPFQTLYFDNFSNYNAGISTGTLPFIEGTPSSSSYFRMPCDGNCQLEVRASLMNDSAASGLSDVQVDFGLFRLGSSLAGGTASEPVCTINFGVKERAAALSVSTTYYVSDNVLGVSDVFKFFGNVSANSGDYIALGVYPSAIITTDTTLASVTANGSPYVYFSVNQD